MTILIKPIEEKKYKNVTHAELLALKNNSNLRVGNLYCITDFQTIYDRPDYIDTGTSIGAKPVIETVYGDVEPIIVVALSSNKLAKDAWSLIYPKDSLEYDININKTYVNNIDTKGKITYRTDEKGNSLPLDFRNITLKRYDRNGDHKFMYVGDTDSDNYVLQTVIQGDSWGIVQPKIEQGFYEWWGDDFDINNNIFVNNSYVNLNQTDSNNTYSAGWIGWNKVTGETFRNVVNCREFAENTILQSFFVNKLLNVNGSFAKNTLGDFERNLVNAYSFQRNIITARTQLNTISTVVEDNTISGTFSSNNVLGVLSYNNIEGMFTSNDISFDSVLEQNKISNIFTNNVLVSYFAQNNITTSNFSNNTITSAFVLNNITSLFTNNVISGIFENNTIKESFRFNNVGDFFIRNTIFGRFESNNENVSPITNFINNFIMGEFRLNIVGDGFHNNRINGSMRNCIFGDNFGFNIIECDVDAVDFTSVTHVYAEYTCWIFKDSSNKIKLRYIDADGVMVVVDVIK